MNPKPSLYPDLYNGYFNVRDPYIKDLEDIYEKPVQIPIYSPEELFAEDALHAHYALEALLEEIHEIRGNVSEDAESLYTEYQGKIYAGENFGKLMFTLGKQSRTLQAEVEQRDFDIFKYFHFIAAKDFQLEPLKALYRAYRDARIASLEAGTEVADAMAEIRKKNLLDFQADLEANRKIAILNAY